MADLAGANGERTEFKVVGQPNIPGKLSYNIATGKAKFGSDVVVPGMLSAKFLRSPYAHAKVKNLDASKAKALPGVVDIVTWEDPDLQTLRIGGPMFGGERPLLDNEADMEDDEVAVIVIAESEDVCDQALNLLKIDWEILPHITDPRDGAKSDAPIIRVLPKGKGNVQVLPRSTEISKQVSSRPIRLLNSTMLFLFTPPTFRILQVAFPGGTTIKEQARAKHFG
jgi:CO/xanthine dehydrogenase Mo-binding subunit